MVLPGRCRGETKSILLTLLLFNLSPNRIRIPLNTLLAEDFRRPHEKRADIATQEPHVACLDGRHSEQVLRISKVCIELRELAMKVGVLASFGGGHGGGAGAALGHGGCGCCAWVEGARAGGWED